MSLREDGEAGKLLPEDARLGETSDPICSLNDAWLHSLDNCVIDNPLSGLILPLMRTCFFGGAMHAIFLLEKGLADQLTSDIASFLMERPQS